MGKTSPKKTTQTTNQATSQTYDPRITQMGLGIMGRAAQEMSGPAAQRGMGMLGGLGQAFDPSSANPYIAAFTEQSRGAEDALGRTLQNTLSGIQDQSGFGMGGSRNTIAKMQAAEMTGRQQADLRAQAIARGMGFAQNVHGMNQANMARGAQMNLMLPMQRHAAMMGMLGQMPKNVYGTQQGTTTTTERGGDNPFMDILGMGMQGAGMYFGGGM